MSTTSTNEPQDAQAADAPALKASSQPRLPFNVPDHLEGRPWKDLTPAERFEVKKYRMGRAACESCGFHNHDTTYCRRLGKLHKQRSAKGLCLECGSSKHDFHKCPKRKAIAKQLGPIAKQGEVRPSMVGMAYKYMTAWEKKDVRRYRIVHDQCLPCGGYHDTFDCPKRSRRIQDRLEQQKKDIASGKLEIKKQFTSTLAVLPVELRLQIWKDVVKSPHDIQVRQGMMPEYMFSSGLPFRELFEVWLKNNVFSMSSKGSLHRFDRLLSAFSGHKFVTSVKLPWIFNYDDWSMGESTPASVLDRCTSLQEVRFVVVGKYFYDSWRSGGNHMPTALAEYDDIFSNETEDLLEQLAAHKKFRTVVLTDQIQENSRCWPRVDYSNEGTCQRMKLYIRDFFEQSGHSHIEISDGRAEPQPIASQKDGDDDEDGW